VPNVTVTFSAPGSGASALFGGPASVLTNASGIATSPTLTANSISGIYTVNAAVSGVATPAQFSLTNVSGPAITTTTLPAGAVGEACGASLSATGGSQPYSFSVASGALPPGLNLLSNGQINGIPTTQGTYTILARVTDSIGANASKELTIRIVAALTITT